MAACLWRSIALDGGCVGVVLTSYRCELKRIPAWPALLFTSSFAFAGVWGLLRLDELSRRSPTDYGYEGLAGMAMCLAGVRFSTGLGAALPTMVLMGNPPSSGLDCTRLDDGLFHALENVRSEWRWLAKVERHVTPP